MIVINVFSKNPSQMSLVDDNDMVQTVPAARPDNAFTKRILPWRARRCDKLLDTQTPDPSLNLLTINRIPITQKIAWSRVERKSLHQLLRCPLSSGMRCHIEVHDVTAVMAEHDKHIENAQCSSRDGEEINPGYTVGMVFKKRPPGLRRRFLSARHVLCTVA